MERQQKKINFYLKDEHGDSSIIRMKNYTKKITVNCQTLDNFVKNINKKIKLIKIEAEGAEPEVVYGLKNQLKKFNILLSMWVMKEVIPRKHIS